MRSSSGQASVEVVALLPLLAVVAAVAFHVLAAGAAQDAAAHGAHSAAAAVLQDRDPEAAARFALPGWPRENVAVRRSGPRLEVTVRPRTPIPALARRLTARAVAYSGPVRGGSGVVRGGDGQSAAPRERRR